MDSVNTLDKAIESITKPATLRRIAQATWRIDDLGLDEKVDTISLAIALLQNREMRKLVEWLMAAQGEEEVSSVVGALIVATRQVTRE